MYYCRYQPRDCRTCLTQVLSGQLWSVLMKEWVGVPKLAVNVNIVSISLLVVAVTVIAIAGAVL